MVLPAKQLARVAIAQLTSSSNVVTNMSRVELMTQYASKQKADIIFFPENFHFMGTSKESSLRIAEPLSGPSMEKYRSLAKSNNVREGILYLIFNPMALRVYYCQDKLYSLLLFSFLFSHADLAFSRRISGKRIFEGIIRPKNLQHTCFNQQRGINPSLISQNSSFRL